MTNSDNLLEKLNCEFEALFIKYIRAVRENNKQEILDYSEQLSELGSRIGALNKSKTLKRG